MTANTGTILVVDDDALNRILLSTNLRETGYAVATAENGQQALEMLHAQPFDVVLLDLLMPGIDGYQVLEKMKSDGALRHIPVIVISAMDEMESVVRCIEMGATDHLPKPFNPIVLRARISASLVTKRLHDYEESHRQQIEEYNHRLETRVREQVQQISSSHLATIFALAKLVQSREPDTGAHLEHVREYCKILAVRLSQLPKYEAVLDPVYMENLYAASPLHDVGKVGIPDHILLKPGKFTAAEFEIMKTHSLIGANTLRAVDRQYSGNAFISMGIEIAISHHERWNGAGYPQGLAGEAVPLSGRILALVDVYDAVTSKRCYKEAASHLECLQIILHERGKHFDPDIVDAFLATEKEFEEVRTRFR